MVERCGASAEFSQIILQLDLEFRIVLRPKILILQLLQRVHERLRYIAPAVFAKSSVGVRQSGFGNRLHAGNVLLKAALGQAAVFSAQLRTNRQWVTGEELGGSQALGSLFLESHDAERPVTAADEDAVGVRLANDARPGAIGFNRLDLVQFEQPSV